MWHRHFAAHPPLRPENPAVTPMSTPIVSLNGAFIPHGQAMLSIDDRAALFADGVYEVIRCQHGKPFALARHAARLRESMRGIGLAEPMGLIDGLPALIADLLAQNHLTDAKIYLQISRGAAPRNHVYPVAIKPGILLTADPVAPYSAHAPVKTFSAITAEDTRWSRCCWKTLMLLPNTMARTCAERAGAGEALFVRSEPGARRITEGSATNAWAVIGGVLRTHPANQWILPGITRMTLLEEAQAAGIAVEERAFTPEELARAGECFVSGTITGVAAVVAVDGNPIGNGAVGPVTRQLFDRLAARVNRECV